MTTTKTFSAKEVTVGQYIYVWCWVNGTTSPVEVHKVTAKTITVDSYEAGKFTENFRLVDGLWVGGNKNRNHLEMKEGN